jgi:hypothetical protein
MGAAFRLSRRTRLGGTIEQAKIVSHQTAGSDLLGIAKRNGDFRENDGAINGAYLGTINGPLTHGG